MKKSTKFLSLLTILIAALGLTLTGCGSKSDEEKAADSVAGSHDDAAAAADEAAKQAEKDAAKLKEEAEKALKK